MESIHPHFKLILGSSSIARRKILTDMGYQFTLMSADIDEKNIRKDKPEELVLALAEAKAEAIMQRIPDGGSLEEDKSTLLITCDQVVVYEDAVREKPSSVEEAREYIRGYSKGHTATVSSVAVTNLKTGLRKSGVDRVEIYFNEIPEETIEKLIEEGTVLKVAGALLIEHPLILPCVKEVAGTTDSVMGLPKELTEKLIKEVLAMASG
ncbi:PREDICTED: maf-like protein DDB_G0281937 isoform X2 [Camelina sativa]|uniref:Maf-like protein DDB_G0281937 isoform X2 n=1 Tax=Camelina sativa TaxID=90675 RepID=A0ABM0X7P4_CAMSA|nr:PREDICTED: maf-like protein DDB_G0281937 isoform X2 [Camelina sativa]